MTWIRCPKRLFFAAIVSSSLLSYASTAFAQTPGIPSAIMSAGVTQSQWDAVRARVVTEARRVDVTEAALLAAAEATGARFAGTGRLNALSLQRAIFEQLDEQANQIAQLQRRLEVLSSDTNPAIGSLFTQARTALNEGRLTDADALLSQIAERDLATIQQADAEVGRRRLRAGDTIISRGTVAYLQADYLLAAQHAARATAIVPPNAIDTRWIYCMLQADALKEQGLRFDGATSLRQSIRVLEDIALPLAPPGASPQQWARTQNAIGVGYSMLADFGVAGAFERAVAAYRAALTMRIESSDAETWAETHLNLGNVLIGAGARGSPAMLDDAVAEFQAALQIFTANSAPSNWATAQNNLGLAFYELGERGRSGALEQSVRAFRAALRVRTLASDPAGWASTQNNLGLVYAALADGRPDTLRIAIEAYQNALSVRSRVNAPADWADTKINLSNAYSELGEAGETRMQEAAIAGYLEAAEVYTRDAAPARWALIQMNLGTSYSLLAEPGRPDLLDLAIQAYENSRAVRARSGDEFGWALTSYNLAFAYRDRGRLSDARDAAQGALGVYRQLGDGRRAQQTEALLNTLNH